MTRRGATFGLALLAALCALGAGPSRRRRLRRRRRPCSRSAVDLVAVDVSVVDSQGRPLLGLAPEDFDDRGGRAAACGGVDRVRGPRGGGADAPGRRSRRTTAATTTRLRGGWCCCSWTAATSAAAAAAWRSVAAERFLATVAPSDRVGLAVVPGPGPNIEFTADLVHGARGAQAHRRAAERAGFQVPLAEALALFQYNDRTFRWQQFVDLECGRFLIAAQLDQCINQMESEAQQVFLNHRSARAVGAARLETVFLSLRDVPRAEDRRARLRGPGHRVAGETRRTSRERAAAAQVTLFVLLLDSSGRRPRVPEGAARDAQETGPGDRRRSTTSPRSHAAPCCR